MRTFCIIIIICALLAACGTTQPLTPEQQAAGVVQPSPTKLQQVVDQIVVPKQPDFVQRIIDALETDGPAKLNADLDAAAAYFKQTNDTIAIPCPPAIKAWVATLPKLPAGALRKQIASRPPAAGLFTAWAYVREDRRSVEDSVNAWRAQIEAIIAGGRPAVLLMGCAPVIEDTEGFFKRIGVTISIGAAAAM